MKFHQTLPSITGMKKKRLGRGYGSGVGGHASTRGQKGQKARNSVPLWFEGGQLPLVKRIPMLRGKGQLNPLNKLPVLSLTQIARVTGDEITLDTLKQAHLIKKSVKSVKILAGKLDRKIAVKGISVSSSARKMIEQLGGSVE